MNYLDFTEYPICFQDVFVENNICRDTCYQSECMYKYGELKKMRLDLFNAWSVYKYDTEEAFRKRNDIILFD